MVNARDVALGMAVTGARAAAVTGRLVLLPVRVAARVPVVGSVLRRAGDELAADGRSARAQARRQLEDAAGELLDAPEVERVVDRAASGSLTDAVARSLAEHRVVERVAAEVLATPEFEEAIAEGLEHDRTQRAVERALASPGLDRLVVEVLESRLTAEVTERIASSPELRAALARQTTTFGEEVAAGLRGRLLRVDAAVERAVLRWLRRPRAQAPSGVRMPYGGIATRAIALALDVALALLIFLAGAALLGLVASLVGELRPAWLVATLAAAGWTLVVGSYLVLFWTVAGQTPGMRMMRLRVADARGEPPRLGRSLLRLLGLGLAIVPLFAGFLPILVDDRRRGLHDFLAGTVVISTEPTQGHALELPAPVAGAAFPAERSPGLPTETAGG